jgi:hypothetical protein
VTVTTANGTSNAMTYTVTSVTPSGPSITSLTPNTSVTGTATSVTIAGANFGATQGTSTVNFGTAAGVTVTSWSASSIVVNVPASVAAGAYSVTVTTANGTSNAMTYTVTSVTPPPGPVISAISPTSGVVGSTVIITGTNFGATQGTSTVNFGMTAATATAWSDTSITVTVPVGLIPGPYYNGNPAGVYDVTVTTDVGTSNAVPFTVLAEPAITLRLGAATLGGVTVGQRVTFRGAIKPGLSVAQAVRLIVLKQRANGKWAFVRYLYTPSVKSAYGKAYTPSMRGTYRIRAFIAKKVSVPAWHTAARSPWRTFRVK